MKHINSTVTEKAMWGGVLTTANQGIRGDTPLIVTYSEKRFFEWHEDDKSVNIRASGASYGGERSACLYQKTIGALAYDDYKGPNKQYVDQNKLIIEMEKETYSLQAFGEYREGGAESTLKERDYKDATDLAVEQTKYIVRRLTPTECARLQGFPDWWCADVPHADSAEYKMWGNGVALPCVLYVMEGIAEILKTKNK